MRPRRGLSQFATLCLTLLLPGIGCQKATRIENGEGPVAIAATAEPTGVAPSGVEPASPRQTGSAGPSETGPSETGPSGKGSIEPPAAKGRPETGGDDGGGTGAKPDPLGGRQDDEAQRDGGLTDEAEAEDDNPFRHRAEMPDLPRNAEWINSSPLTMKDLRGKFVLFDFWTYCCINCIHVLPELKKLERAYPNQLVVIGVHSAKFETEKDAKNIAEAVLRYEIEHPVLVDSDHRFWNTIGVRSWPTVLLADPQGRAIWGRPGEMKFEDVKAILDIGIPYYRSKKLLDEKPIRFELLAERQTATPLRFPGKVLADEAGGRLFITDSNHNRLVVTSLDGKLLEIIGSGEIGRRDGAYGEARFYRPQGVALHQEVLYVADTENHLLRKVDLKARRVTTIAGVGEQGKSPWPGLEPGAVELPERFVGEPAKTAINSPWALLAHGDSLYIAMAGPHQIWRMTLDESEIGPYAGNGREDIVDGPLLPDEPYGPDAASFAQPSGLTSDGQWLYVADSEGSSIRAVPFDAGEPVRTVVGSADLPYGRLFEFGDVDGDRETARLQHALGVAYHDGAIYVADTYNDKIKRVEAGTGEVRTVAGGPDAKIKFDEPAGLSYAAGKLYVADTNNHAIRVVDPQSGQVETLTIDGLTPPGPGGPVKPDFSDAEVVEVEPVAVRLDDGDVRLSIEVQLPPDWKFNELAPMQCWLESQGRLFAKGPTMRPVDPPAGKFELQVAAKDTADDTLVVSLPFFYCQADGKGLCKVGSVVWKVPVSVDAQGETAIKLRHAVDSP